MPHVDVVPVAQGPALKATQAEIDKEATTYTDPNLHRRIMEETSEYYYDASNLPPGTKIPAEIHPRTNDLGVYGFDSYRTFTRYYRDDDTGLVSETEPIREIP